MYLAQVVSVFKLADMQAAAAPAAQRAEANIRPLGKKPERLGITAGNTDKVKAVWARGESWAPAYRA